MRRPEWFPIKSLSFWTSAISVAALGSRRPLVRMVGAFCGLICGIGGAGVVYERASARSGVPLEPIMIARYTTRDERKSLALHLIFAVVGAYEIWKLRTDR